jgi:hypothetical protein
MTGRSGKRNRYYWLNSVKQSAGRLELFWLFEQSSNEHWMNTDMTRGDSTDLIRVQIEL